MHLIHDIWHDSVFDTSTVHLLAINKLSQTKCCNKILEEKATLVKTELRLSQFSVPSASSDHSNAQPPHTEKLHFRNTRNTWERAKVRGEGSRVSSACIFLNALERQQKWMTTQKCKIRLNHKNILDQRRHANCSQTKHFTFRKFRFFLSLSINCNSPTIKQSPKLMNIKPGLQ